MQANMLETFMKKLMSNQLYLNGFYDALFLQV